MCRESLLQYLKTQTPDAPPDFMEHLVRQKTLDDRGWLLRLRSGSTNGERLEALLDAVKICDPAIGSGAFPMGMLHEIFDLKLLLDATLNPAKTKQQVIQSSIYGVDIDRGAVDIARLRFWLSLVVDEDQPQPLPNLDYKIMQGNSLLESYNGIPLDKIVADERMGIRLIGQGDLFLAPQIAINFEGEETLEDLERQYFDADDPAKKARCKKKIDEKVLRHLDKSLEGKVNEFFIHIEQAKGNRDKLVQGLQGAQLEKAATSAAYRKAQQQVDKLIGGLDQLEASRSQLHEEYRKDERNFFLWHLYFKPVFEQGGFDIAIGNPPYVQIQKLPAAAKATLEAEGYDTFAKTGDLYCLFYEKALRILRPGGMLAFITSNSWLKTLYGEPLRRHFTTQADPLALLNFEDTQIFKAAIVETNILLAQKGGFHDHLRAVALGKDYLPGQPLTAYLEEKGTTVSGLSGEAWHIGDAKTVALKAKLEGDWKRLKEWDVTINFGIKTGFNKAFILSDGDIKKLPINDSKLIKPILRGRDIEKYGINDQKYWLIYASNGYLFSKEEQKKWVHKVNGETNFTKGGQTFKVFREEVRSKNSKRYNRVIVSEDYPDLMPHFEQYEAELKKREDQGDHWTNLRNCDYGYAFEQPKIIWSEISDAQKFVFDDKGFYTNNKCFIMTGKRLRYLLAILNSKVSEWYFNQISTTTGMGTTMWAKYKIEQLPIAAASEAAEEQLTALVDKILAGKKAGQDTHALEATVDVLVFKLYGLGYEEAAAIATGLDVGLWEGVELAG